jgi:hypothetical protein
MLSDRLLGLGVVAAAIARNDIALLVSILHIGAFISAPSCKMNASALFRMGVRSTMKRKLGTFSHGPEQKR